MKNKIQNILRIQRELIEHRFLFSEEEFEQMSEEPKLLWLELECERERLLALINILVQQEEWREELYLKISQDYDKYILHNS